MAVILNINPINDENPGSFADRVGQLYSETVTSQHKKEKGQFFTPPEIARFMANLANQTKSKLKILDPGCGTVILSSSLIERLAIENTNLKEIELVVYETDLDILPYAKLVLDYLEKWLKQYGVKLASKLNSNDFVLDNKDCFEQNRTLFSEPQNESFDIVISNPPYFKIPKDDKRALIAKSIVWGQPNIYSIFMMVATHLLKPGGELIFITPRSFTAGNYFRAFREALFQDIEIRQIHLFGSRKETFDRDSVLQETLILKGVKQRLNENPSSILLTHSNGLNDIDSYSGKLYPLEVLVDLKSKEKIIHLPMNEIDDHVIKLFKSWPGSLHQYDIQISTGPVVSFRASQYLFEQNEDRPESMVPLYQLINTSKMSFDWPLVKRNKPQYILKCDATKPLLLPNKNYIFLRRFSAKDDKSRLVACPYYATFTKSEFIGLENHLNYIYRRNGLLEKNEILGLSALLNSNLFDTYFRTFNGNINVSATELREMPLPPLKDIKEIGKRIVSLNDFSQSMLDGIINEYFELDYIFAYE